MSGSEQFDLTEWNTVYAPYTARMVDLWGWSAGALYDHDDLLQEGFLLWCKVVDRYPDVGPGRHRMSLYKTALRLRLMLYARQAQRGGGMLELDAVIGARSWCDDGDHVHIPLACRYCDNDWSELLDRASRWPPRLRTAVTRLVKQLRGMAANRPELHRGGWTVNDYLCRLAGCDSTAYDLEDALLARIDFR